MLEVGGKACFGHRSYSSDMENFRLKVFRTVAHHLNFRMAAEQLFLTQPAVTQQIKALEAELDTALFDRSGGRIALTLAGAALLPFAERLASLANEARQAVAATSSSHAGALTLAASQTIGQYLLPRLIAAFLAENPKVEIHVLSGNTKEVLEYLFDPEASLRVDPNAKLRADVALIEGPVMRQDVRVDAFMEDHMVCVVPAKHEWADEYLSVGQLQQAAFVTRELGSGSRRIVEQALEAAGIRLRDLNVRMTFDSTEGLLSAVEAGLGIAFVSRWAVRSQLALGTLHVAHFRELQLSRMFSLALPAGPKPVGIAGSFHRFVLDRAESLAPRATGKRRVRPEELRVRSR
jgi:DNA-binding transcriptional LysR family regulator